jgi:hypothetical protein
MNTKIGTVLLALAVVAAACGGSDSTTTTSVAAGSSTTTTATPTTQDPSTTTTAAPTTTTAAPGTTTSTAAPTTTTTTTTAAPTTTTTLAGEPIDLGPLDGDLLIVIGVVYDDTLNVRQGPGLGGAILTTLAPTAKGIVATGNNRLLPNSIWFQIETEDALGWASGSFLAYEGFTDDITAAVVNHLGGIPTEATMDDLAAVVATTRASVEPESKITTTIEAASGDLHEITIDVVGLGDDALRGERLHIFGEPLEGGGFSLKSVERTLLCGRGVAEGGLCV